MKFSEFCGNERIVNYFRKAIERNQLGHAYLFSGPAGVGKATLARILCKTLLCRNSGPDGPCEICPSCHKFESGNHPDYHPFAPEGLYFKIDQVRSIIHLVSLKPVESKWKTFLLEGADYMRDEGANALLKVLEEPPGQTIYFLISEMVESLLPTIRSRCQQFTFQPLSPDDLRDCLVRRMSYSPDEAANLARYSHGSIGRALMSNEEEYTEMRSRILGVLEAALLPKTFHQLFEAIRSITVERTEMVERFMILEELVRDLLILKSSESAGLIHADARKKLETLAERTSTEILQRLYEDLLTAREAVTKVNANVSLSLQWLFLPLRASAEVQSEEPARR
jgi:DNA polymerase III subunit delta'